MMEKINAFLDRFVLPWPVKFLTHRFVILATIALLAPLIVWKSNQVFVLAVNSYLNTMSVAVSSIVLLYATIAEIRDHQIAQIQEQRAQEDHAHVVEIHEIILENMRQQHEEIESLKEILTRMQGLTYERKPTPERLKADLKSLHPRGRARFTDPIYRKCMATRVPYLLGKRVAEIMHPYKKEGENVSSRDV